MKKLTPYALRLRSKKAFTLIEMSIVILIIGVMIVGVIGASGLVRSAVINSARTFTIKSPVSQINGLVAWYETSLKESLLASEAYDNAQITTWYDINPKSLVGTASEHRNVLTKTASSGVTYVSDGINNAPSIYFDSSCDSLKLSSFFQGASYPVTIFLVLRPAYIPNPAVDYEGPIILDNYNGTPFFVGITGQQKVYLKISNFGITSTASNPANLVANNDYIMSFYMNGNVSKAFINDANTKIGNSDLSIGDNSYSSLNGLTIGADREGNNCYSGLISEIIIYNRALNIQERRDIMKYLSYKYKIPVTGI